MEGSTAYVPSIEISHITDFLVGFSPALIALGMTVLAVRLGPRVVKWIRAAF